MPPMNISSYGCTMSISTSSFSLRAQAGSSHALSQIFGTTSVIRRFWSFASNLSACATHLCLDGRLERKRENPGAFSSANALKAPCLHQANTGGRRASRSLNLIIDIESLSWIGRAILIRYQRLNDTTPDGHVAWSLATELPFHGTG